MDAEEQGDHVELRGFGRFRRRQRRTRVARNPTTGETVHIPAKTVPWFSAGKAFHARVQTSAAPNDPDSAALRTQMSSW